MSIDTEKTLDKFQQPFITKTLQGVGIKRTYLNIIMTTYHKPTANIILNSEKLKALPLRSEIRQGCLLSILSFNRVYKVPAMPVREEKERKGIQIGKE